MPEIFHHEILKNQWEMWYEQIIALANRYTALYPETLKILDISWVSPFWVREMKNPYTNEIDSEDFSNIGRHCVVVAYTAEKIAMNLFIRWIISKNQLDEIIQSALLHDGDKRIEVMRKKAARSWYRDIYGKIIDVYSEEGYETIGNIFLEAWVDDTILATIQNMWWMTGHNSLRKFVHRENWELILDKTRTLTEMIVHIADDMTHSPNPDTLKPTIITNFIERAVLWNFSERYPFLWNEGLEMLSDGFFKHTKDVKQNQNNINYYDAMNIVFQMICDHLKKQIDPTSTLNSVEFILWLPHQDTSSIQDWFSKRVQAIKDWKY